MTLAWSIYFIDFPQVRLYVFAHVTLVWCQHFRTRGVQWRQFTKCSDPSVLWRLISPVLLVRNSCFWSRIIDETLMFNCTPGLVSSPLYRRVSTSGPLYCGYSQYLSLRMQANNKIAQIMGHGICARLEMISFLVLDQQNRTFETATVTLCYFTALCLPTGKMWEIFSLHFLARPGVFQGNHLVVTKVEVPNGVLTCSMRSKFATVHVCVYRAV